MLTKCSIDKDGRIYEDDNGNLVGIKSQLLTFDNLLLCDTIRLLSARYIPNGSVSDVKPEPVRLHNGMPYEKRKIWLVSSGCYCCGDEIKYFRLEEDADKYREDLVREMDENDCRSVSDAYYSLVIIPEGEYNFVYEISEIKQKLHKK